MPNNNDEIFHKAHDLWTKYFALTEELLKFINKQDIDTFLAIVPQRGQLIEQMKALPENDFRNTEECKKLIEKIKPLDMQIMYKARAWLNKSRRQNGAVRSYDLTGTVGNFGGRGSIFNRQY